MRHHPFDDDGGEFSHWCIPFNTASRRLNRSRQKAPYRLIQSISGARPCGWAVGLASLAPVTHQARDLEDAQVLGDRWLRDSGPIGQGPHGQFAVPAQPARVTGLTLAFGASGGGFRRLAQIVFVLSIAFAASSFFLSFFSLGGGALV
jgi:hypothetical protein